MVRFDGTVYRCCDWIQLEMVLSRLDRSNCTTCIIGVQCRMVRRVDGRLSRTCRETVVARIPCLKRCREWTHNKNEQGRDEQLAEHHESGITIDQVRFERNSTIVARTQKSTSTVAMLRSWTAHHLTSRSDSDHLRNRAPRTASILRRPMARSQDQTSSLGAVRNRRSGAPTVVADQHLLISQAPEHVRRAQHEAIVVRREKQSKR